MPFSEIFFKLLILTSLVLMTIGVISLVAMLLKDIKTKKLW